MARRPAAHSRRQYVLQSPAKAIARELPGVRSAPFPGFVDFALATLVPKPPKSDRWVCELKFDGYRFQMHKLDTGTKMFTRRGNDWTAHAKHIVHAAYQLTTHAALLDGEVVVQTPEGLQDFSALESAIGSEKLDERLLFYVFDILFLDGFDLRGCTLLDRKRVLKAFLEDVKDPIRYSEHWEVDAAKFFHDACELGFEGLVAKLGTGKYHSGRTADWVKTTCRHRDTFVVAGWAEKNGRFDGIYLGKEEDGELVYAGKLEHGFGDKNTKEMLAALEKLKAKKQPIAAGRRFPKAKWVKPRVLVDAEFRGKTPAGLLRHPSFKGIRRDLMEK